MSPASAGRFAAFLYSQFFSAFNDNIHRVIIAFFLVSHEISENETIASHWQLTVNAAFVLPFILFSPLAGGIADRFSKRSVMIVAKWLEVVPISVSLASTFLPAPLRYYGLILGIFLMETRSAFFSPCKYGILPEVTAPDRLVFANGLLQLFTMVAIVSGEGVGGFFIEHLGKPLDYALRHSMMACLGLAVVGALAAFAIPRGRPGDPGARVRLNPLDGVWSTFRHMRGDRVLVLLLGTLSFFWLVSAMFAMNMPIFGQNALKVSKVQTGMLWAVLSVGIGVGAFLAGLVRSPERSMRLVLPGGLGMGLASIGLSLWGTGFGRAAGALAVLGVFGGFYLVPQMAMVQKRSPDDRRGAYMALQNFANNSFMILASGVFFLMKGVLGFDSVRVFLAVGIGLATLAVVQAFVMSDLLLGITRGRASADQALGNRQ